MHFFDVSTLAPGCKWWNDRCPRNDTERDPEAPSLLSLRTFQWCSANSQVGTIGTLCSAGCQGIYCQAQLLEFLVSWMKMEGRTECQRAFGWQDRSSMSSLISMGGSWWIIILLKNSQMCQRCMQLIAFARWADITNHPLSCDCSSCWWQIQYTILLAAAIFRAAER